MATDISAPVSTFLEKLLAKQPDGTRLRRTSWPEGKHLVLHNIRLFGILMAQSLAPAPGQEGLFGKEGIEEERVATDWIVMEGIAAPENSKPTPEAPPMKQPNYCDNPNCEFCGSLRNAFDKLKVTVGKIAEAAEAKAKANAAEAKEKAEAAKKEDKLYDARVQADEGDDLAEIERQYGDLVAERSDIDIRIRLLYTLACKAFPKHDWSGVFLVRDQQQES